MCIMGMCGEFRMCMMTIAKNPEVFTMISCLKELVRANFRFGRMCRCLVV